MGRGDGKDVEGGESIGGVATTVTMHILFGMPIFSLYHLQQPWFYFMTYLSGQILKGVQIQTVAADRNCGSVNDSRKLRFIPSLQLNYCRH